MFSTTRFLVALAVLLATTAACLAERKQQDKTEATDVVTGTVQKITTSESEFGKGGVNTTYSAEIKVDKVERGKNIKPGDAIIIHWSRVTKQPQQPIPGAYGHKYDVAEKATVRAYLETHRGGYYVIYNPAGVEKLDKGEK